MRKLFMSIVMMLSLSFTMANAATDVMKKKAEVYSISAKKEFGLSKKQTNTDVMKKKADFYANSAKKEFGLSKKQTKKVYDLKLEMIEGITKINERKDEYPSKESFTKAKNTFMKPLTKQILKTMGKTWPEIKDWSKKVQQEMNAVK